MSDIFDEIQSFIEDQQLSFLSTVRKVAENRMSFSRFGDGEIRLMLRPQYDLKFQKNSPQLAESLRSVLTDSSDGLFLWVSLTSTENSIGAECGATSGGISNVY